MWRSLFPRNAGAWLGPAIVALASIGVLGAVVIGTGAYDVAADRPHPAGWARLLHATFDRSVAVRAADLRIPDDLDARWRVREGAAHYGHVCAACHGGPGLGQNPVALGMRPAPPVLGGGGSRADLRHMAWVVDHGVKYSGMPAWPVPDRMDEVWSMVAFLRRLDDMDTDRYRQLAYGAALDADGSGGPAADFGSQPGSKPMKTRDPGLGHHAAQTPATGFTDFALLDRTVPMCSRCHDDDSLDGHGDGGIPDLALQDADYLSQALHAYASGERKSGFMGTVASQLSDRQIEALSDYYAGKPGSAAPAAASATDGALLAEGRRIARHGIPDRDITQCGSCHGTTKHMKRYFPRLAGQYAQYLVNQLELFARGVRGDVEAYDPMYGQAHKLTPKEMRAVAAWYSTRPADASAAAPQT